MASSALICDTEPWKELQVMDNHFLDTYNLEVVKHSTNCISFVQAHAEDVKKTHLRDLLSDEERSRSMVVYDA